jgi:hypothetical protein
VRRIVAIQVFIILMTMVSTEAISARGRDLGCGGNLADIMSCDRAHQDPRLSSSVPESGSLLQMTPVCSETKTPR